MPSQRLSAETKLSIELDAICSRNRYTTEPAPVLAELRAAAGTRVDILTESVGVWVGYFQDDYTQVLCSALRELADVDPWIRVGAHRRSMPDPSTPALLGHGHA